MVKRNHKMANNNKGSRVVAVTNLEQEEVKVVVRRASNSINNNKDKVRDKAKANTSKSNNSRRPSHRRNRGSNPADPSSMASFFSSCSSYRWHNRHRLRLSLRNSHKANSRRAKEVVVAEESINRSSSKSSRSSNNWRNNWRNKNPSNLRPPVTTLARRPLPRAPFRRLMARSSASRRIWPV